MGGAHGKWGKCSHRAQSLSSKWVMREASGKPVTSRWVWSGQSGQRSVRGLQELEGKEGNPLLVPRGPRVISRKVNLTGKRRRLRGGSGARMGPGWLLCHFQALHGLALIHRSPFALCRTETIKFDVAPFVQVACTFAIMSWKSLPKPTPPSFSLFSPGTFTTS